ncbi:aminotransferase class V-fold PLP-dependent enzyme [Balneola sp. MJW-20]|uniref:aminotransferase class V-fold PLP-dependent enzyme n=1 Tax=Gracilimonas aurantiaca TaxID=3234185 RepID=UPI003466303A
MLNRWFKTADNVVPETGLAHDEFFNELRQREYSRLDKDGHVYLDYTGGNLYGQSQLDAHFDLLRKNTFGNPHSTNPTSQLATQLVDEARGRIIDFFNADDYHCVFTSNASNALKIVGECYPFEKNGQFLLFTDNHNSVNGIREYCKRAGGAFDFVPMNIEDLTVSEKDLDQLLAGSDKDHKLFAFPAQSNVSGIKHDLSWIEKAQELGWDVLLDAAAFVPTSKLDLKEHQPDYVSLSFYKMFGYPTGIGCLLVKKSSFATLEKKWFAGGTVKLASSIAPFHFLTDNYERFENGTLSYLEIPAITTGLDYLDEIGMDRLSERVQSLVHYLHQGLKELEHNNGEKQLHIFGLPGSDRAGGTMIMTFRNPDGSKIDFEKIEELANKRQISIRSGCFCNPGLDETTNCITTEEIAGYFQSRDTGDYHDMIQTLHKMRGATRVSVGLATTKADLDAFINFVKSLKDRVILSDEF